MNELAATSLADLRALFGRRVRMAKASFLLGLGLHLAAFVAFVVWGLDPFGMPGAAMGVAGFVSGLYFLAFGLAWSTLWAFFVHLGGLADELAGWIGGVVDLALTKAAAGVQSGAVVDLPAVERQIAAIVDAQTAGLQDAAWVPLVRQWAPGLVRGGLRLLVVRVAGDLWQDDRLTVDALRSRLAGFTGALAVAQVKRLVWIALALLAVVAALVLAAPFGTAAALRLVLGLF